MKSLADGDDEVQLLEIQNERLLRDATDLKAQLETIKKSKAYRFANRLRGRSFEDSVHTSRSWMRAFQLAIMLIGERIAEFCGWSGGHENSMRERYAARRRLRRMMGQDPGIDRLLSFKPKPDENSVRVLVMGVGGIGDVLSTIVVATALKQLLAPCEIYVAHTSGAVQVIATGNNNITASHTITHRNFEPLQEALAKLDLMDLIVDYHYCVRYIRTASHRIEQRLPLVHFLAAASAVRPFVNMLNWWPVGNNMLCQLAERLDLSAMDIAGVTGCLDINDNTAVPLLLKATDHRISAALENAHGRKYVTVHNGVDNDSLRNLAFDNAVQPTKLLPMAIWKEVVGKLKSAGVTTVQLGQREDILIQGVDYDLRGKTTLLEAAAVLKYAACHLDTEGGLVHLARGGHSRSIVLFCPTSVRFFGYPQNINLVPAVCGNCWWTTPEWLKECPRHTVGPECMTGHSADTIVENALAIIAQAKTPRCEVTALGLFRRSEMQELQSIATAIHEAAGLSFRGLDQDAKDSETTLKIEASKVWGYSFIAQHVRTAKNHRPDVSIADVGAGNGALGYALAALGATVDAFDETFCSPDDPTSGDRFVSQFARVGRASYGSVFNLPAADATYDVVIYSGSFH